MTELLTSAQMRAIEAAAIASGMVTGLELMERAGRGVVEAIFEEWPALRAAPQRAVVLCGPGNNGGDGFVVARLLKEWGWEVALFLYGDPARLPPDARTNYLRWCGTGEVRDFLGEIPEGLFDAGPSGDGVVVDALFGTGLARPLDARVRARLAEFRAQGQFCGLHSVAVDMPSGIDSDSGRFLGEDEGWSGVQADLCVTFHRPRVGHFVGEPSVGRLVVKDIGLDGIADRMGRGAACRESTSAADLICRWSGDLRKSGGHKYTHGHALILSGPPGRAGAGRLAARGALRIGAGLVTLGCPPDAMPENAARLDAVMLRPVADGNALAELLVDPRVNAVCLGPGLGTGAREMDLVAAALGDAQRRAVVLDADALTLVARHPELFALLHEACVLTPHAGEFARLFPDIAERLAAPAVTGPAFSRLDATRAAAARAGCVVLFKGPDTVIADPAGRCAVNAALRERAAPWLATAGSGDVLAGFIAGLLARGFSPFDAACTGGWLHVEAARRFGPGLIAEDLPEALSVVFRDLGL
ncbi:NAD(P)H-hydrate dehydratase [Rhodovulum strictum]|uniref:Bifunctional NAD(P)H-hydrate repair enzyme n=1 Tax=Rhodovulum strictum TaxID=58314 RepID=A0A844BDS8_9RHOB|nr:NAD(P)H-hydrate dehydratase [Rhodovulum strictum]MRH19415.1 NAD(P)H-hydrate dehydratase [Rhodovulum strictum]